MIFTAAQSSVTTRRKTIPSYAGPVPYMGPITIEEPVRFKKSCCYDEAVLFQEPVPKYAPCNLTVCLFQPQRHRVWPAFSCGVYDDSSAVRRNKEEKG
ncbi:uncharacterized [Tachysurus ichikawai]